MALQDDSNPIRLVRRKPELTLKPVCHSLGGELWHRQRFTGKAAGNQESRSSPDDNTSEENNKAEECHTPAVHLLQKNYRIFSRLSFVHCITQDMASAISSKGSLLVKYVVRTNTAAGTATADETAASHIQSRSEAVTGLAS
jgi:hypothetical protein